MRIAQTENTFLHWQEDGDPDGVPVVFVNSLGTDLRLWDKVVVRLPRGLRLIRFDLRGHGLSACPDGPYSMDGLADDVAALLAGIGISRCVFVGLSIGGMIGQVLAGRRDSPITALVLSNTAARMGEPTLWNARVAAIRKGGIDAIADAVMERWFAPAFRKTDEMLAWRTMLSRTPREGYIGCCHAIAGADLTAAAAAIDVPTLGIAGDRDGASPPAVVQDTIALIPGARCHVIEGSGHLPCVEDPDAFCALLMPFLEETARV